MTTKLNSIESALRVRTHTRSGGVLFTWKQECSNSCHADRDGEFAGQNHLR